VYAVYYKAAVTVRSPLPLNTAANAVPLLHPILLMRTPEVSLKIQTALQSKSPVTKTLCV
jgi:hypothetical protein